MELKRENFEKMMEQYDRALSLAKKSNDLKLELTVLENKECTLRKYNRDDLAGICTYGYSFKLRLFVMLVGTFFRSSSWRDRCNQSVLTGSRRRRRFGGL